MPNLSHLSQHYYEYIIYDKADLAKTCVNLEINSMFETCNMKFASASTTTVKPFILKKNCPYWNLLEVPVMMENGL